MEKWIVLTIIGLALTLSGCGQQSSPEGLEPEPIVQLDPAVRRELTRQLEQRVELLAERTRTYLTCRPKSRNLSNDLGDVYQKWEVRFKEPVEAKLTRFRQKPEGPPTKYGALVRIQIEKRAGPVSMTREEAIEWMEFNVVGAWVGETTPIFVHEIPSDQKVDEFLEDLGFEPPINPSNDN